MTGLSQGSDPASGSMEGIMERKRFGSYVQFIEEPETEEGKKKYVKIAVDRLLDQLTKTAIPDWNTLKLIIHEGFDVIQSSPDWYDNEKEDYEGPYVGWVMTVGLKYESETYCQPLPYDDPPDIPKEMITDVKHREGVGNDDAGRV